MALFNPIRHVPEIWQLILTRCTRLYTLHGYCDPNSSATSSLASFCHTPNSQILQNTVHPKTSLSPAKLSLRRSCRALFYLGHSIGKTRLYIMSYNSRLRSPILSVNANSEITYIKRFSRETIRRGAFSRPVSTIRSRASPMTPCRCWRILPESPYPSMGAADVGSFYHLASSSPRISIMDIRSRASSGTGPGRC
ncbi:hypothetical protein BDZ97DRAFT_1826452, partial [Flammula alnicola]